MLSFVLLNNSLSLFSLSLSINCRQYCYFPSCPSDWSHQYPVSAPPSRRGDDGGGARERRPHAGPHQRMEPRLELGEHRAASTRTRAWAPDPDGKFYGPRGLPTEGPLDSDRSRRDERRAETGRLKSDLTFHFTQPHAPLPHRYKLVVQIPHPPSTFYSHNYVQ